jgi:phage tail sheath protein FI
MYRTPGVYREDIFPPPPPKLRTGVPVFVGLVSRVEVDAHPGEFMLRQTSTPGVWLVGKVGSENADSDEPDRFTLWPAFEGAFGAFQDYGYLAYAVRGFFENQGSLCYVQMVCYDDTASAEAALAESLNALKSGDAFDLVCAPDIMWPGQGQALDEAEVLRMQGEMLAHCDEAGDRMAILDSWPGADVPGALRQRNGLSGTNGALYYPWIKVSARVGAAEPFIMVPPCGHVAGVYARSDQQRGVHKAPANEVLEGVVDLEINLTDEEQGELNPKGVNCLRACPGRGIRVWGARILSGEPWVYVNVRRLFLTAGRWIQRNLSQKIFEPNDSRLWEQIKRELTSYFSALLRQGGLRGNTAQDAFYIKCDEETNPPEVRDAGMVVTDIGLAAARPNEFIVVRIIHNTSGVTMTITSGPLAG